ncbi:MAG: hypothetical protein KAT62_00220 [Desulfuromonadales bacterium]|nr:hypothetical protein [Desulfuromonadales bacterium]
MPELLTDDGLVSLFLLSFCAATLLPSGRNDLRHLTIAWLTLQGSRLIP